MSKLVIRESDVENMRVGWYEVLLHYINKNGKLVDCEPVVAFLNSPEKMQEFGRIITEKFIIEADGKGVEYDHNNIVCGFLFLYDVLPPIKNVTKEGMQ